ncbi:unnamed protein product, partial [Discosporangium mesarthrocarpum]
NSRRSQRKVEEAVDMFITMESWDGLAEIMRQLPSGAFCRSFRATVDAVPHYYSGSRFLPLKVLAHMPKKFYMDIPGVEDEMTEVAASVYRLVLSDLTLANIFGEVDLSWLPMVKSASTVVAMVIQAESDTDERTIDLEKHHLDCSDVDGEDIKVLVDNRRLAVVLNFAFVFDFAADGRRSVEAHMLTSITEINLHDCNKLTDESVNHIMKRASQVCTLTLSGCSNLTDKACSYMVEDPLNGRRRGGSLTYLDLGYCLNISDHGMNFIVKSLDRLKCVNLAGCIQLTDTGLLTLVSTCTRIQNLVLAQCKQLTDKSMCHLADFLWIEELDISYCSRLSDDGIEVLAMEFSGLCTLAVTRCSRLTERALDVLVRYCPHLKTLVLGNLPLVPTTAIERAKK